MPRETFIDLAGKPFTIETDLLASDGCFRQRADDRLTGRKTIVRRATSSSRSGVIPGRGVTINDFEHATLNLCSHGQRQARCSNCLTLHCACPGTAAHQCGGGA